MPVDLSNYLVIGISSRALFDLSAENEIYEKEDLEAYAKHQLDNENVELKPGIGFSLVKGLLELNQLAEDKIKTEVIVMSRNSADTSLRIFNSIEHYGLDISRAALTSGRSIVPYLEAFKVDLFLSADEMDVQNAIEAVVASGYIYKSDPEQEYSYHAAKEIKIAFDGDAVLFSEESELIYKNDGLDAFLEHEKANTEKPLPEGPFAKFLKTLSFFQSKFDRDKVPIRTALVTARNSPAHKRVILTLRHWGVRIDEAFFMSGVPKNEIMKAFGAHIFFDDQDVHLKDSSKEVPSAKVMSRIEGKQDDDSSV